VILTALGKHVGYLVLSVKLRFLTVPSYKSETVIANMFMQLKLHLKS